MSATTALADLTVGLISAVAPSLTHDRRTRERIIRQIREDESGGPRKEWVEVKETLTGSASSSLLGVIS
jgi:hypothetical protein